MWNFVRCNIGVINVNGDHLIINAGKGDFVVAEKF